jgi:hypothetical protein
MAFLDEPVNGLIELIDVVMCPGQRKPRAMKQIIHGQKPRSDKRPGISKGDPAFRDDAAKASFGNEGWQA